MVCGGGYSECRGEGCEVHGGGTLVGGGGCHDGRGEAARSTVADVQYSGGIPFFF